MVDGKFTAKERAYLASLPAVESVSASHIRYADSFRIEVMCRYNAGESPAAIFREAGLDPKLIGTNALSGALHAGKSRRNETAATASGWTATTCASFGIMILCAMMRNRRQRNRRMRFRSSPKRNSSSTNATN